MEVCACTLNHTLKTIWLTFRSVVLKMLLSLVDFIGKQLIL